MNHFLLTASAAMVLSWNAASAATSYTDVSTSDEFQTAITNQVEAIRINADFETTGVTAFIIDSSLEIDLNGHTVTLSGTLLPRNNVSLTIDDLSQEKTGVLKSTDKTLVTNAAPGELTINGGTFTIDDGAFPIIDITKDGSCTINGGRFNINGRYYAVSNEGILNINGGTFVGRDRYPLPIIYTTGEGVTEMTDGAIYAGNGTHTTCFETVSYTDPTYGEEIATLKLPEGVYDGGAIVLSQKWAIPGTRYINYHMPENAEMQPGLHYYTPGTAFYLPECNTFNDLPFAGWSKTENDNKNLFMQIDASTDEDLQLYPIWKYLNIADGVDINLTPESVDPTAGGSVETLSEITLRFGTSNGDIYIIDEPESYGYVANKTTGIKVCDITSASADWDGNVTMTFEAPVEKNGTYEVFVPAGLIGNDTYYYDNYQSGACNPDLRYTYRVENNNQGPDNVTTDPADGSTVTSLHTIKFIFVDEEMVLSGYIDEPATLTDEQNTVVGEISSYDTENIEDEYNAMIGSFENEITAPGTYTLHVPKGFFSFDWWERDCSELTFTYTISDTGAIDSITSDTNTRTDVYDIYGRKVLTDADAQQISTLPKGIYIAKGTKFIVK